MCTEKVLKESKFSDKIRHWSRYVDDILIVWAGTSRQMDHFLTKTNAMNDNIKFTVEKGNNTINYLDLTLKRERPNLPEDPKRIVPPPKA
jgi:hypothetical protein